MLEMRPLKALMKCCQLRRSLYKRLAEVGNLGGAVDAATVGEPLYPLLSAHLLRALNARKAVLLMTIHKCIESHGEASVLVDDGF